MADSVIVAGHGDGRSLGLLGGSNKAKDEGVRSLLRSHGMRFVRRMGFRKYSELWEGFLSADVDGRTGQHKLREGSEWPGCAADPAACLLSRG